MPMLTPAEQEAREAKLPQWVRDELYRLRRNVEHMKADEAARLKAIEAGYPGEVDTWVWGGVVDDATPLGRGTSIIFRVGPTQYDIIRCRVDRDNGTLKVMSDSGRIHVLPEASNSIVIQLHG